MGEISSALRPLGLLAPQEGREWSAASIDLTQVMDPALSVRIIEYLSKCPVFIAWMEYTRDQIGDRFGVHGGSAIASDGRYYWRVDASEYIREYGIAVPEAAVRHMEYRGWRPPEFDRNEYINIYRRLSELLGVSIANE